MILYYSTVRKFMSFLSHAPAKPMPRRCVNLEMWGFFFFLLLYNIIIIESVDSISRDGPDTPIYIIHYKSLKISTLINYKDFKAFKQ